MKQPKFRGFSEETNRWVYGFGWYETDYTDEYLEELGQSKQDAVLFTDSSPILCNIDSMSQYTGLKDCKGNEIYGGDILQPSNNEKKYYTVVWRNGSFAREYRFIRKYEGEQWEETSYANVHADSFKVIGNIFEQEKPIN